MAKAAVRVKGQREGDAREILLTAARDLMIEVGTHDVSLHAIARRAGFATPLVKYYFGSKEGLLVELVERDTGRSLAQLRELLAMPIDPVTKLRIHVTGIIRTYDRVPYLLGLLGEILRGQGFNSSDKIRQSFALPLIEAQRKIIEEGVEQGLLKDYDPDQLYFFIVGACQYLFAARVAFRDMMGGKPADPEFAKDFAVTAVDIILNGMRT